MEYLKAGRDSKTYAPVLEACALISLGDVPGGLAKFEQAAREIPKFAAGLSQERCFDVVRANPRFRATLKRLGVQIM